VFVAEELICKVSKWYARQSFRPDVCCLCCGRALFAINYSVLNEFLNKAHSKCNVLAATAEVHVISQSDAANVVFVNVGRLKLRKAELNSKLTRPHNSQQQLANAISSASAVLNATILGQIRDRRIETGDDQSSRIPFRWIILFAHLPLP